MHIIGLGHQKQTGKNTFADILYVNLNEHVSVRITAFARKLYDICHDLYGWAGFKDYEFYQINPEEKKRFLPKIGKTVRDILIDFGTKAVRNNVYGGTWVDYVLEQKWKVDFLLITDVRFPNEIQAIQQKGGTLIKVTRPNLEVPTDIADTALNDFDGWDKIIENNGTRLDLSFQAQDYAKVLLRDWEIKNGR